MGIEVGVGHRRSVVGGHDLSAFVGHEHATGDRGVIIYEKATLASFVFISSTALSGAECETNL